MRDPKSSHGILTHKGKLLMLLRDDNPEISSPNTWSLIGGQAEENETFEEALLREIKEETNIEPLTYQLLISTDMQAGYFVPLSDDEVSQMRLGNEGQALKFFEIDELENLPLAEGLKELLLENKQLLQQLLNN